MLEFESFDSEGFCGGVLNFVFKFRFAGTALTGGLNFIIFPNVRPATMPQTAANASRNENLVLFTKISGLYH